MKAVRTGPSDLRVKLKRVDINPTRFWVWHFACDSTRDNGSHSISIVIPQTSVIASLSGVVFLQRRVWHLWPDGISLAKRLLF